jgi:hypothetical protein
MYKELQASYFYIIKPSMWKSFMLIYKRLDLLANNDYMPTILKVSMK